MKKKNIHACDISGSLYGKKGSILRGSGPSLSNSRSKDIRKVYNSFYKEQLKALYNAIHKS